MNFTRGRGLKQVLVPRRVGWRDLLVAPLPETKPRPRPRERRVYGPPADPAIARAKAVSDAIAAGTAREIARAGGKR